MPFHGSRFRTFKDFYTLQVLPHWTSAFPNLVSYTRFVELVPWSIMPLMCMLQTTFGEMTGISFIDATPLTVCDPNRASNHKAVSGRASEKRGIGCNIIPGPRLSG